MIKLIRALKNEITAEAFLSLALDMHAIHRLVLFWNSEINQNYLWTLWVLSVWWAKQDVLWLQIIVNEVALMEHTQLIYHFESDLHAGLGTKSLVL